MPLLGRHIDGKSRLSFMAAFLLAGALTSCDSSETPSTSKPQQEREAVAKSAQPMTPEALKKSVAEFLDKIEKRDGVEETASGLKYEILEEGTGARPSATDEVVVHYTGTLTDGTKFDSSRDRGEPAQFPLNRVIRGWTEGLQLMTEGSRYKFYIPAELGYGAQGAPGAIPPNADLIFDVELIKIAGAPEPAEEPDPHPAVAAFLQRGIPSPTCGDMPAPSGSESDDELAALQTKGNEWQNCMAAFIKTEMTSAQSALNELQAIEASQVPSDQRMEVNVYLQKFSTMLNDAQSDLEEYKGISKS